jgi:hypothetical protein
MSGGTQYAKLFAAAKQAGDDESCTCQHILWDVATCSWYSALPARDFVTISVNGRLQADKKADWGIGVCRIYEGYTKHIQQIINAGRISPSLRPTYTGRLHAAR